MTAPIPIEVRLARGLTVRGHEFTPDGPPVVFVHEPGRDLDAWQSRTSQFADKGFKVFALDLAGNGLSDGEADQWESTIGEVIAEIGVQWGPVGVVAAGESCRPFLGIGADDEVPVQALISPSGIDEAALGDSVPSMRLMMCGPGTQSVHQMTKAVFDRARGQKLMITGGGAEQGSELIVAHGHLLGELVMWFRRFLTGYHLAWVKEITSTPGAEE